ncbi:lysostaphin resistance A-like protein [Staphylococcus shinii]|uniref:CPBP family intramembrane glutamic endopeptidase n=1 Tax=Staphylococcus shinii TaxID=2912228 RepID=UPI003EF0119F
MKSFLDELWYRGYHALIWTVIISLYLTTGVTENINHIYTWFTFVLIMLGLIAIMYTKSSRNNKYSFEVQTTNKNKVDIVQCIILIIIAFLIMIIVKQLYIVFIGHGEFANDELIKEHIGMLIPFFITSCIVSPIVEEIVFRGYSYMLISEVTRAICNRFKIQRYEKVITIATYIIVPSVIFGIAHKQGNIYSLITYMLAGVVFALLFLITKNIWASILAHIINNSYAALQMVYVNQTDFGNEWVVIGWLSIVVVVGVLIYMGYPKIKEYFMNYDKRYSKS